MDSKTIKITVKCLDSSNFSFDVSPQLTVKEFKEFIQSDVSIPADSQRMIYCGRVLKDDQRLEQHDLNGKAIHLVQRPPPTTLTGDEDRGRDSPPPHHTRRRAGGPNVRHTAFRLGGNLPPSLNLPSSSQMRASTAQRMFNGARSVIHRIGVRDDDEQNPLDFSVSDLGNRYSETIAHSVEVEIPMGNATNQDAQAAVSAALAAVAQSMGIPGIQGASAVPIPGMEGVPQNPNVIGLDIPGVFIEMRNGEVNNRRESNGNTQNREQRNPQQHEQPQDNPTRGGSQTRDPTPPAPSSETPLRGSRQPRVGVMADLVEDLQSVQDLLRPHVDQVRTLLRNDPVFASREEELEAQHVFRRVSEAFHYLAHGYHALSDLMVDFRRAPPRNLYGVPYLVQSMAVVQGVIPVQAEIQIRANTNHQSGEPAREGSVPPSAPTGPPPPSESFNPMQNISFTPDEGANAPSRDTPRAGSGGFTFRAASQPFRANLANILSGNRAPRPAISTNIANLFGSLFRGAVPGGQSGGPTRPSSQVRGQTPPLSQQPPSSQSQGLRPVPPAVPISSVAPGNASTFDEFLSCNSHHLMNRRERSTRTPSTRSPSNAEPMDFDPDLTPISSSLQPQPWHSRVPEPWIHVISQDVLSLSAIYSRRPSFSMDYVEEMPPAYRRNFAPLEVIPPSTNTVPVNEDIRGSDGMEVDMEVSSGAGKSVDHRDSDEDL
ncbi:large proline-rich protein BAG6-like [Artemia franciscana]|uniref:Large proline-rich protein BAG6 n=1 Tax=Artemia franciscana TaxID=6661 RepID=A0AA88LB99_ARTSF|nr:hypothetical protein QYM36_005377 [Artemia franciscana]